MTLHRLVAPLAVAAAALVAGCATAPADSGVAAMPAFDAAKSCQANITQLPKLTEPEAGVKRAWAVVQYELDGSGSASAVRISSSSGSIAFDTGAVRSYALAKFTPGVKRSCTEVPNVERR